MAEHKTKRQIILEQIRRIRQQQKELHEEVDTLNRMTAPDIRLFKIAREKQRRIDQQCDHVSEQLEQEKLREQSETVNRTHEREEKREILLEKRRRIEQEQEELRERITQVDHNHDEGVKRRQAEREQIEAEREANTRNTEEFNLALGKAVPKVYAKLARELGISPEDDQPAATRQGELAAAPTDDDESATAPTDVSDAAGRTDPKTFDTEWFKRFDIS